MYPKITLFLPDKRNYACFYADVHELQFNYGYLFKNIRIEIKKKLEKKYTPNCAYYYGNKYYYA